MFSIWTGSRSGDGLFLSLSLLGAGSSNEFLGICMGALSLRISLKLRLAAARRGDAAEGVCPAARHLNVVGIHAQQRLLAVPLRKLSVPPNGPSTPPTVAVQPRSMRTAPRARALPLRS